MTDKKLTDSENVKALECCLDISPSTCKNCPLFNVTNSTMVCSKISTKLAFDLITRLQEDVGNYKQIAENQQKIILDKAFENKKLKAEIKRLKESLNIELENFATEYDNKIKAEAYKEFARTLRQQAFDRLYVSVDEINNLLKELMGDDK